MDTKMNNSTPAQSLTRGEEEIMHRASVRYLGDGFFRDR